MMSKITKILFVSTLLFSFVIAIPIFAEDAGSSKTNITGRLDSVAQSSGYSTGASGEQALVTIVGNGIKIILSILGVVLLGLILYGGFLWMTSGGKTDGVTKGKTMITNAVIGLIIVVSSYAISSFVIQQLEKLSGTSTGTETSTTP